MTANIREEVVAATLKAARMIATEGTGEKQPAHGLLFIIGDSKELLDPDPELPFAQPKLKVCSKYGKFPKDLDRRGGDPSRGGDPILIQKCCENDAEKRALQTLCTHDNAIVVDGASGQVCCGGFLNRDLTSPYGTGARTTAASAIAVNATCVSIKASEDICGTRANPVAPDAKLEVFRRNYYPKQVPVVPPSLESELHPLPFERELKWHVEQFVPGTRDWILDFLISWVRNTDGPRCCVLFAGPGFGKTAIVAKLCALLENDILIAVHLVQHNNAAKRDPCRMIKSFSYQIARALPEYRQLVEEILAAGSCDLNDIAQLFDCLILEPLASIELPEEGRLLIVIDALDEAEHATKNDLLDLVAREFPKLPTRIAVLVTSRRELKARTKLSTLRPKVLDSEENAEECANDVHKFLRAILAPVVEPEHLEATITTAAAKAQGVFLYLYWLRKRLEEDQPHANIEALPDGLAGAYLAQFTRVFPGGFSIDCRKVLEAILAAPVPPHTANTLPGLSGVPRCKDIVGLLSQLFPVGDDGCVYSFHKSIPDWLMGEFPYEDRSDEDPYFIDRVAVHRRAAAACVAALLREPDVRRNVNESDVHAAAVIREEWSGAGDDERDLLAPDDYALPWAITHLVAAKQQDVALALLCSLRFVTLRVGAGQMAELIADTTKVPGAEATLLRRALVLSQNHVGVWGFEVLAEELWQRLLEPAKKWHMMSVSRLARDARRMARGMRIITARHASLTPANAPLQCVLEGHEGGVKGVTAFKKSDGETRVASCSFDHTVRVWDPMAGRELLKLEGHQHHVLGVVAFKTSDGTQLLASCSADKSLRVWDPNAGVQIRKIVGHEDRVVGVTAFEMNNATCLASCSHDKTVRVWDPMTGRELHKLKGHQKWVNGVVAFKMNNAMCLASCSGDTTVRVWNPIEERQLLRLEGHQYPVNSVVAFGASDGPRLASGSFDKTVRIWNPIDRCELHKLEGHRDSVLSLAAFSTSEGTWLLASGSINKTVRIWNPIEGQQLNKLEGHDGLVYGLVAFELSEGVLRLASCSADGTVRIWDPIASGRTSELETHKKKVRGLAAFSMTRDGEPRLASCSEDGTVRVWDPSSRSELQKLEGHEDKVYGVVVFKLNDAICLASCSIDCTVRVWDPTSGRELHELEGHRSSVNGVTVLKMNEEVRLASCSGDKTLRVWDLTEGREINTLEGHRDAVIGVVAFEMNDEVRLATCSKDTTVRVWDPTTGHQLYVLEGHEDTVNGVVAFKMNDTLCLASCSDDKTVRVWDLTTARQLHKLQGHQARVRCVVAFDPTNKTPRLASSSDDKTVRVWDPAIAGKIALFVLPMESTVRCMTVFEMTATGGDDQNDDMVCAFGHLNGTITYWDVRF
ncbi:hypothetical protein CTAYLR_008202 [Chrysophaeum taylorii]|uniref:Nephrocystin 3-like N-terminal domain-containing protein n=1 Tax=Chrysophaeum taylorii TaxID=2483200 RepID=A0AAD7XJX4_9STRA|nr:hypothetical protein CTAYLR_008202 [Chrysophaeum taylorii]